MAVLTNMLVLSAVVVAAMCFPTTRNEDTEMLKNPIIKHETQSAQPLTVDSKSPIVWFVKDKNKTNSIEDQGTANEIYTITNTPAEEDSIKSNQNIAVLDMKDNKIIEKKNSEIISFVNFENKEEKNGINYYEGTELLPNIEPVAISEDLALTLIKPNYNLPEVTKGTDVKENISPSIEKLESIRSLLKQQNIHHAYAVGPALYPQSIYSREFSVPFFE